MEELTEKSNMLTAEVSGTASHTEGWSSTPSTVRPKHRLSQSSANRRIRWLRQKMVTKRGCHFDKEQLLLLFTVLGCILGLSLGVGLRKREHPFTPRELMYLKFPGEIFLRMLQMLILPLIISTIVSSIAQLNTRTAGELGMYTVIYYFTTTFLAVVEGIVLVMTIRPGDWSHDFSVSEEAPDSAPCLSNAVDTILDLIRNLLPENLVEACYSSVKTCMKFRNITSTNVTVKVPTEVVMQLSEEERSLLSESPETKIGRGMNILGLIFFFVVFAIFISVLEEEGQPLRDFFKSLESVMMKLITIVIWYAPIGIIFLTAHQIVIFKDPVKELQRLVGYMITVLSGLFIHAFVVLPSLMLLVGRRNPLKYTYGILPALLTALGTSSSSATLPLTIKCCEKNNNVDPRVTRFVLPLGATINMDGTALYEAVAALYIAQTLRLELSLGHVILVSLTATLASIGAAGIPQAGIVTMLMVLIAIGLPTKYFILIMPVDWFLDRIRTTVNVFGDSLGAGIVHKLCINYLMKSDEERARRASIVDGPTRKRMTSSTPTPDFISSQHPVSSL
ncbi:excitatory amino acid transporter [Trichuris trichiura]|uniref:Amino acid transporter n=1 Tax=Trichuris trichiura TaxID=36087 RepID=A0A077Z0A7_TRITR|nr:excitatory amino acid transporter [Trichuris trichiura]